MATPNTYTVQKGDTLSGIASRTGTSLNNITGYRSGDANLIYPGEVLTLGSGAGSTSGQANSNTAASIINSNQDADIAAGRANDVPSRGDVPVAQRYSTAFSDLKDVLRPAGMQAPTAPSFEREYSKIREQMGIDGLESYVNELRAEEEEIFATLRQRRTEERGKPVATNVIEGRISQTERQESERLDYVRRQRQTAINELQGANATIENLMNLRQLDYNNARQSYNDAFTQQMSLFSTIKGIVDTEMSQEQRQADVARANLNIIYGSITDGTIDKATMTPDMKYQISKMELSAGLPQNFYDNLRNQNPGGKILSTTTRTSGGAKYADVLLQQPDGSMKVQSMYLGAAESGSGGGGKTSESGIPQPTIAWEDYLKLAQNELQMSIDPKSNIFKELKSAWEKDFGAAPTSFTTTEIKKLEQGGLLYADRQAQLDFLYGKQTDDRSGVQKLADEYGVEI